MSTNVVSDKILKIANFNLNLLTTFCLIYSTRSITEVSAILDVTPPSISHALRKLRLHFEDPLFIRHGNALSPTVFADDLYIQLKQTLDMMSNSIDTSKKMHNRETLVIYSPFSVAVHDLSLTLIKIKSTHIDYKIKYIEANLGIPDAIELLNLRKADIVFSATPITNVNLTCILHRQLTPTLVCRKDNPLVQNEVSIEQLKNLDMISHLTGDEIMHQKKQTLHASLRRTHPILETNSFLMFLTLLSKTDCIGFISYEAFSRYEQTFGLRKITPLFPLHALNVYLSYRKEMEHNASFRQFLAAIPAD